MPTRLCVGTSVPVADLQRCTEGPMRPARTAWPLAAGLLLALGLTACDDKSPPKPPAPKVPRVGAHQLGASLPGGVDGRA